MIFRQLFDPDTSTYSYLLADPQTREAVIIDPVREQADRDARILRELNLELLYTLETHVHADHVTGAWALKERLGSRIAYPARAGVEGADVLLAHGDAVRFGRHALEVRATPGHTDGCVTYVTADGSKAFTGDALLIRGSGRTDFQQGDAPTLYHSVHDQVFSLPDETEIYPGHDYEGRTVSTVGEEKLHNPRLGGGRTEAEFVELMANLNLPYPRHIDEALPANMLLGRPEGAAAPAAETPWAPVTRSATGAPHVRLEWVAAHGDEVRLVDVRSPGEFVEGHVPAAELVPLETLLAASAQWERDAPVVAICRSGGRSDRAAMLLEHAGFTRVASMVGGTIAWRDAGHPVELAVRTAS